MKGVILSQNRKRTSEYSVFLILVSFVFEPIKTGLYGFSAFFAVLVITKCFSFLSGLTDVFTIGMEDVSFSLLGFILFFLLKLLENIKEKKAD